MPFEKNFSFVTSNYFELHSLFFMAVHKLMFVNNSKRDKLWITPYLHFIHYRIHKYMTIVDSIGLSMRSLYK